MPNTSQADRKDEFITDYGCGPVSVSNVIIHLAKKSFQMIVSPMGKLDELSARFKLIDQLAKHMKTDDISGTFPDNLVEGLEKYLRGRGYKTQFSDWVGWDWEDCGKCVPDFGKVPEGVLGSSNTILELGWYKSKPGDIRYERVDGHFVTVAGFNRTSNNKCELIIHDPSLRSKHTPKLCTISLVPPHIKNLYCSGDGGSSSTNALGYCELNGIDINKTKGANVAVVDGTGTFEVVRK